MCAGKLIRLRWEKRQFPGSQEAFRMAALIFLIFVVLVVSVMFWAMRKSQAKEVLAKQKSIQHRKKQTQEALTPEEHMTWPVIIRPVSGKQASGEGSDPDHPEEDALVEEPSMTTIEFEPSEHVTP